MTGRYVRKPVPVEGRGLSRNSPDHPQEPYLREPHLLPAYTDFKNEATKGLSHNAFDDESQTQSGCSSPSAPDTETHSWPFSVQSNGWTTGNTTERSCSMESGTSWGDDEIDRLASRTVKNQFDEIDAVLFEEVDSPSEHVTKECRDWKDQFPHLRILGQQTISPQDQGFQTIPHHRGVAGSSPMATTQPNLANSSNLLVDVTEQDLSTTQESLGLTVMGLRVQAIDPVADAGHLIDSLGDTYAPYGEETFADDGVYEDVIALDYRDEDDSRDTRNKKSPRRKKLGYPPLTPKANAKDSVVTSAFDSVWQCVFDCMESLVRDYQGRIGQDVDEDSDHGDEVPEIPSGHFFPPPGIDVIPPSRETLADKRNYIITAEEDIGGRFPNLINLNPEESGQTGGLKNIMNIKSISLVTRERTSIQEDSFNNLVRQGSMVQFNRDRPQSQNRTINSANPASRMSRQRIGRLAPLDGRVKTPNIEEEPKIPMAGIQGHSLQPANERLPTPPTGNYFQKNALPPIGLEIDQSHKTNATTTNTVTKKKKVPTATLR